MKDWEAEFGQIFFKNRNIKDTSDYFTFDFEKDNLSPFGFANMEESVKRLKVAIDNKEKILVYTDYDCDGIPAATVLSDFFKKIGYSDFAMYIPHRHIEGYGLHKNVLERFVCNGYSLVITADLGITNIEEVKYLTDSGVDIILSDHHLPLMIDGVEVLPNTKYLLNPNVSYEKYPNKFLCGAGVAWKIVHAFLVKYGEEFSVKVGWEKWLLDVVAIALVADMVPLVGENRKLVHFGLKVLQKSPRKGIQKVCSLAKLDQKSINEKDIAFTFAPRINAASRMDHPMIAYKMLSDIDGDGDKQAEVLEKLNQSRKESVKDISDYLKDITFNKEDEFILIGNKDWPIGVVGLVAQKLTEETGKTSLVYGIENDVARGSVRAGGDILNVVNLLAECKEVLLHYGGHEQAGGFALRAEDVFKFESLLKEKAKLLKSDSSKKNKLSFKDATIDLKDINGDTYNFLQKFAPFGIGNDLPALELETKVSSSRRFGQGGKHLELLFGKVPSVIFNVSQETEDRILKESTFLGYIEYDSWRKCYQFKLHL